MDPPTRSPALNNYYKNKRYLNVVRYVGLLNQNGKNPRFPLLTAYQLYKNDDGKWCIPEHIKTFLKTEPPTS